MLGDAAAALGIINRKGLGRTRHIDTGLLWIQQTAAEKRLSYGKVLGTDNPADLLTKHLTADVLGRHCSRMNATFPGGRAEKAPTLNYISHALWEMKEEGEEESEEEEEEDKNWENLHDQLQLVVNEVWNRKWRHQVAKLSCKE